MDQGMTNSIKELSAVFSATSAKEMALKAISIMKKLKMMEDDCFRITDSCIEMFCKFVLLLNYFCCMASPTAFSDASVSSSMRLTEKLEYFANSFI
jgi:hypothetical protein